MYEAWISAALNGRTCLISGATGMIGRTLISHIRAYAPDCHIVACVRSLAKAGSVLGRHPLLTILEGDITEPIHYAGPVDYIIHGASITDSLSFVTRPVDTIMTAVNGTQRILELAMQKHIRSLVFLSTMEIYGAPQDDAPIAETHGTDLDTMQVRSDYPTAKRLCEALCTAYHSQFDIPCRVARLTQTIGPGISYDDRRVFAEFSRCAIEERDIVLHTPGETRRMYVSADDAARAILTILLRGTAGEAYNVANEATWCSVREMAELVAGELTAGRIRVLVREEAPERFGYAPTLRLRLDTGKLRGLGWSAEDDLVTMYRRLIHGMKTERDRSSGNQ